MITVSELRVLEGVRRRKPQADPERWPRGCDVEACIDALCGCAGRHDCDCVSVFNIARREAWEAHNRG